MEMFIEMQTSLDNMSVMGLELCRAMGLDMDILLESLDAEGEEVSDIIEQM